MASRDEVKQLIEKISRVTGSAAPNDPALQNSAVLVDLVWALSDLTQAQSAAGVGGSTVACWISVPPNQVQCCDLLPEQCKALHGTSVPGHCPVPVTGPPAGVTPQPLNAGQIGQAIKDTVRFLHEVSVVDGEHAQAFAKLKSAREKLPNPNRPNQ